MDEQRSKIDIAAFADAEQTWLAAGRVLTRNQTKARGKLTARAEFTGLAVGRDQRGRRVRTDPLDRADPLTGLVGMIKRS